MTELKEKNEADSLMKAGISANKKSFFHKPDYSTASTKFGKAGDIYSKLDLYQEAKNAYEQAAIAYDNDGCLGKSGEMYVNAAKSAYQHNENREVLRLLQEGKVRFLECGQPMNGARKMKDMAVKLRSSDPQIAYELYDTLLEIIETSSNYHWEKDAFVDFAILAYEMQKFPETFQAWDRAKKAFLALKNNQGAAHCVASAIAIHLQRNDIVSAEKLFNEEMQNDWFIQSEDFSMIDYILRGVKNRDGELIELGQNSIILGYLKPEISRIIYGFKAPKKDKSLESENPTFAKPEPVKETPKPQPEQKEQEQAPEQAPEQEGNKGEDEEEDWLR